MSCQPKKNTARGELSFCAAFARTVLLGIAVILIIKPGIFDPVDLLDRLGKRSFRHFKEKTVPLVDHDSIRKVLMPVELDRVIDYFAQRRLDHEHTLILLAASFDEQRQDGFERIATVAQEVH